MFYWLHTLYVLFPKAKEIVNKIVNFVRIIDNNIFNVYFISILDRSYQMKNDLFIYLSLLTSKICTIILFMN